MCQEYPLLLKEWRKKSSFQLPKHVGGVISVVCIAFASSFKQGFPKNAIRNFCACTDLEFLWSHKTGALNSRCTAASHVWRDAATPSWLENTCCLLTGFAHTLPDALPCHFLFPASQNSSRIIQSLSLRALSVGVSVCSFTQGCLFPVSLARNTDN